MFSKIWTKTSTPDFSAQIERLKTAIAEADAVVIGAGAGLSTAAGFTYSGERFERYFSDFAAKYGIRDMYSGGFFLFPTSEEFWAYWSRYILTNRYMDAPKPVYWYGEEEKSDRRGNIRFIRRYFPQIRLRAFPKMAHAELVMIHPEEFCRDAEAFWTEKET